MNPPASRLISADSHVTEPPDLWVSRIDRAFRDRAPHYVHDADRGGLLFLIDGQIPKPVNVNIAVGQRPEDYREFFAKGLEAARPGGWDPVERLKDMDVDGVECAVLYTSQGFACSLSTILPIRRRAFEPTTTGSRSTARMRRTACSVSPWCRCSISITRSRKLHGARGWACAAR